MLVILHRELWRLARKRQAFSARLVSSAIGLAIAVFLLLTNRGSGADGQWIFRALTFCAFAFALIQGSRVAAGSIADEKRDGTLPLLFLTPLRPIGIIVGKLFATGLPLIQPFAATIPALAITALQGGVTGGEIARAGAVVPCALFLSISAGLCVSSFSRRYSTEGRTTLTLIAIILALPLLPSLGPFTLLRFFSPWTAFQAIGDIHYSANPVDLWLSLVAMGFCGIALLLLAVFFLPRRWAESERKPRLLLPAFVIPAEARATMLNRSPAEWLAMRRTLSWVGQIPFSATIGALSLIAVFTPGSQTGLITLAAAAAFLLIRLAAEASFPFSDARRCGAVELLLCTPLKPQTLVTGQAAALWGQFTIPTAILLFGAFFYILEASSEFYSLFTFIFVAGYFLIWEFSIASLGMFLGVLEKNPTSAFFQTILVGIITAGLLSILFPPMPFLLLLGLSANRLASKEFPRLLKRPAHR
jgi:hypothetical protein